MKRSVFILIALIVSVLSSSAVMAQDAEKKDAPKTENEKEKKKSENDHIKRFKAFRRDFLAKKTQMTQEEADAFFPLYDELSDKKFKLHYEVGEKMKKVWDENKATEEDYNAVLDAWEEVPVKEAALVKEYNRKFRKILSSKKLFRLKLAEEDFSREIMKNRPDRDKNKDKKENTPDEKKRSESGSTSDKPSESGK